MENKATPAQTAVSIGVRILLLGISMMVKNTIKTDTPVTRTQRGAILNMIPLRLFLHIPFDKASLLAAELFED